MHICVWSSRATSPPQIGVLNEGKYEALAVFVFIAAMNLDVGSNELSQLWVYRMKRKKSNTPLKSQVISFKETFTFF